MMSKRLEYMNAFYNQIEEDVRLSRSRQGQMEYITTMNYIHRFAKEGCKILEIGAGTGRYSIALAKGGYDVTSVELVERNLDVLKKNSEGLVNIHAYQGDALDLSRFDADTFEVTLVFGPMYHLYNETDVHKAIDEALRVAKKDGVVIFAFLSAYAIMYDDYFQNNFAEGFRFNFTEDCKTKHFEDQLFTGYDIVEFEQLFENKDVDYITTVAADSVLELAEGREDFGMSEEDFEVFAKYHLSICEKREMLGCSSHLLYICKKR